MDIKGKTLGTCVINNYLIVFTHEESSIDRIYKINSPDDTESSVIIKLFEGDLGFNLNNKIQTLPFYENEKVQKVYWIDGINQPRVINIAISDSSIYNYTNISFDFIQNLTLNEIVSVSKQDGGGTFKSGVIQYAFTYFNKNGAESNIFQITPLNYISPLDRGSKVDEFIQNSFKINITGLETTYEYVRIYSIYRSSIDTTPEVKSVIDLKITPTGVINYVDNNVSGSIVSSDLLLYVGGEEVIPQCMSQKNNTLFFGNINLPNDLTLPATLVSTPEVSQLDIPVHISTFEWTTQDNVVEMENSSTSGNTSYPYKPNSLNKNDNTKHFKFDETYRLGVQGQSKNGKWSTPIWLGSDHKVDKRYNTTYSGTDSVMLSYVSGKYHVAPELKNWFIDKEFIKVRPVMVPLNYSDRTIIAQGIVNNTLGVMSNRLSTNVGSEKFTYPDYLFRTNGKPSFNTARTYDGQYAHFDLLKLNNGMNTDDTSAAPHPNRYIEVMGNATGDENVDYHDMYDKSTTPSVMNGKYDRDFLFVDKNLVNFWSPDLEYNSDIVNSYIKSVSSVGLYGFAFQTGGNFKFKLDAGNISNITGDTSISKNISNYYNGTDLFNIDKRLWMAYKDPDPSWDYAEGMSVPIWSPKSYEVLQPDTVSGYHRFLVDFTQMYKSGISYFGINRNLKDSAYKLNINIPSLIFNDSDVYYKSNNEDNIANGGNILYSKNVEKDYPSGSFSNVYSVHSSGGSYPLQWYKSSMTQGMSIEYNTSSHALFSFEQNDGLFTCMPRLNNPGELSTIEDYDNPTGWYRSGTVGFRTPILNRDTYLNGSMDALDESSKNTLPIFDLYANEIGKEDTRFGGTSADALYSNNWIPCGSAVRTDVDTMILNYTDGDTYIQRFDFLRVFPNDLLQIPQHTEIVSFLCESFINVDGRSDVNRYNTDSSLMTPSNYGLMNNVYSQRNNFFNYNILDPLLFNTTNFNNTIVWTKTKVSGAITDNWTNISMLSSIDLDGVNGAISSINLFNNDLYVFQGKGVARLLYNERVQQQSSDGISVELTNGYKVPDYRYLTNQYGCENKWSIVEGKGGIYFVDYINKSLICIGEGIKDISTSCGFTSWFNNNTKDKDYTLSYDRKHSDLYIHDDTICLNYSETLQSFISFYDYIDTIQMNNVWDDFISIKSLLDVDEHPISTVWLFNKGDYNSFYGVTEPFSVEYLINSEPTSDKVFNTIEYRLDNTDIDWNDLEITNWYQYGHWNSREYMNKLKRRFSVNRVQLPRRERSLDRIRSTWVRLKLSHIPNPLNINAKFSMQDLTITYTI